MNDTWSHATNNILHLIIIPLIATQVSFTTHTILKRLLVKLFMYCNKFFTMQMTVNVLAAYYCYFHILVLGFSTGGNRFVSCELKIIVVVSYIKDSVTLWQILLYKFLDTVQLHSLMNLTWYLQSIIILFSGKYQK